MIIFEETDDESPPSVLLPHVITLPSFSKAAKALSEVTIVFTSLLITPAVTAPAVLPPESTLI